MLTMCPVTEMGTVLTCLENLDMLSGRNGHFTQR